MNAHLLKSDYKHSIGNINKITIVIIIYNNIINTNNIIIYIA
jgi:hypothetical protein